uniref:Putative secreted peptide n=1 Tax=Anopheles braziliensis TaxID=58242 RepID=A0A2M3ZRX0_9DIPT
MLFKIEFGLLLCVWFSSISLVGFRWLLPVSHATATTTHHVLKSLLSHNVHLLRIPFDLGRIPRGGQNLVAIILCSVFLLLPLEIRLP